MITAANAEVELMMASPPGDDHMLGLVVSRRVAL
jgi:hypothetical protein